MVTTDHVVEGDHGEPFGMMISAVVLWAEQIDKLFTSNRSSSSG